MTTPHQSTDKITCSICGKENVPDWDGQGHCIKCARDLVLGDGHPSSAFFPDAGKKSGQSSAEEDELKLQNDLPDKFVPDPKIQIILIRAGVRCSLDSPKNHNFKPGEEPICELDKADYYIQELIAARDRTKAKELLLTKTERWDYKRLKRQEIAGLEAVQALAKTPTMSAERIVHYIAGLSPHNLPTSGVWALKQYAQELLARVKAEVIGPDQDPNTSTRGFKTGYVTRENRLRAKQRTLLDELAKELE